MGEAKINNGNLTTKAMVFYNGMLFSKLIDKKGFKKKYTGNLETINFFINNNSLIKNPTRKTKKKNMGYSSSIIPQLLKFNYISYIKEVKTDDNKHKFSKEIYKLELNNFYNLIEIHLEKVIKNKNLKLISKDNYKTALKQYKENKLGVYVLELYEIFILEYYGSYINRRYKDNDDFKKPRIHLSNHRNLDSTDNRFDSKNILHNFFYYLGFVFSELKSDPSNKYIRKIQPIKRSYQNIIIRLFITYNLLYTRYNQNLIDEILNYEISLKNMALNIENVPNYFDNTCNY